MLTARIYGFWNNTLHVKVHETSITEKQQDHPSGAYMYRGLGGVGSEAGRHVHAILSHFISLRD